MDSFELGTRDLSVARAGAEAASKQVASTHSNPSLGIERQLHAPGDIASARNFFAPKVEVLTTHTPIAGLEHSGLTALKAMAEPISPLLQLIMRLPSHVGIFGSFFEVFKNLFVAHGNVLSHFNLANFGQAIDLSHAHLPGLAHLGEPLAGAHSPIELSILPSQAHIFETLPSHLSSVSGMARLHISPVASLKHSMNVSADVDLKHLQFETATPAVGDHVIASNANAHIAASEDILAGPSISAQVLTPQLSPDQTVFSSKLLESASGNHISSNALAMSNNQTTGITNNAANSAASTSYPANTINQGQDACAQDLSKSTISDGSIKSTGESSSISSAPTKPSVQGLHAQELSLKSILHKDHSPINTAHNPFSKLASKSISQAAPHSSSNNLAQQPKAHLSSSKPTVASKNNTETSNAYKIESGDSLWRIAHDQLGDGSRWQEIYSQNFDKVGSDPNLIHTGNYINLPDANQHALPGASQDSSLLANNSSSGQYTVKSGDNLWRISKDLLGNGQKWTNLYKVNSDVIGGNPRMILPGQQFKLPGINAEPSTLLAQNSTHTTQHVASATTIPQQHTFQPNTSISHAHHDTVQATPQHVKPTTYKLASNLKEQPVMAKLAAKAPANGLTVEGSQDPSLSGAGGAQAAAQSSAANKTASNLVSNKSKSIVSFSLTPDISFLTGKK